MKCPKCNSNLRIIGVNVEGAQSKVLSMQCQKCDYFEFENKTASRVLEELRDSPLKIKDRKSTRLNSSH